MTTARINPARLRILCVALAAAYPGLADAAVAGRVQFVAGEVRIVDAAGKEKPLAKGQDVSEGDTISSAANGSAQLKMIDGAVLAIRPGTQVKVEDYVFSGKEDGTEKASFSLVKGGLRAITGLIGKTNKDNVRINTPTATIGIRGTDHEPMVILPGTAGVPAGTYDKVNVGATSLTNQAGVAVVSPNQVGFAASPQQAPVVLPKVPDFYRATPAPQTRQDQKDQKEETRQAQEQKQGQQQPSAERAAAAKGEPAGMTTAASSQLTASDAKGNTLNLTGQTLTTPGGQTLAINDAAAAAAAPTSTPVAPTEVFATFPVIVSGNSNEKLFYPASYQFGGASSAVTRDAAGNVSGVSDTGAGMYSEGYRSSLAQSGSTLTDFGKTASGSVSWGRWQGGQVTQTTQYFGMDASGKAGLGAYDSTGQFVVGATQTTSSALGSGSLHWLAGTGPALEYLPRVLTGTATYTLAGGTRPTDQLGNTGALTGASLGVNFTTQSVDAGIAFTIGGNAWNMQATGLTLEGSHFGSYSNCKDLCASPVVVSKNGAVVSSASGPKTGANAGSNTGSNTGFVFGHMNGALFDAGLSSAGLQYAVQDESMQPGTGTNPGTFVRNLIQGVAAFSGPAQDVNTPFRAVGIADGWNNGMKSFGDDAAADPALFHGTVEGGETRVARVVDSPAGLTRFEGRANGYTALGGTTAGSLDSGRSPAMIDIGSAVNREVGSTTIGGTTVSWGRWEGGSIDIYSRDGATKLGSIDNSGRSIHWLTSSILGSDFSKMPMTGTATYALAGNTSPTDLLGNVGKLNAATLNADFANAKVNAGVSVSFNGPGNAATWSMSANNVPLMGNGFESSSVLNGINGVAHTASCAGGGCGAQTQGKLSGVFFGSAQGAVMVYGIATGTAAAGGFTPANSVTGLAVMKR